MPRSEHPHLSEDRNLRVVIDHHSIISSCCCTAAEITRDRVIQPAYLGL